MDLVQFAAVRCGQGEARERGIERRGRGDVVRIAGLQSMGYVEPAPIKWAAAASCSRRLGGYYAGQSPQ
jgi:hypothetical protein